jgi:hypothetical protein
LQQPVSLGLAPPDAKLRGRIASNAPRAISGVTGSRTVI